MDTRSFIKLWTPPAMQKIIKCIRHKKLEESPLVQIKHNHERCVIIGNGPSLTKSVEKYENAILSCDRISVNFFASTDLYERLQPNIYVFADPAFFWIPANQKNSIHTLFENIVSKTAWEMAVIVPFSAHEAPTIGYLTENNFISIYYYYDKQQDVGKLSKFQAWDQNLIAPPAQNVVNVALYLSLYWNYKETYLIGVDMSSLEDIRIDQVTNELFSIDRHFYKNDSLYSDRGLFDQKRGRIRSDWTLHDYIYAFGKMFEFFYELKRYADYKGLAVYNASEYSWINVFERRKLSE